MAFRFFRRRQKTVIIIMAVLMVTFLVGFQGISALLQRSASKDIMGALAGGIDVTWADKRQAAGDLEILKGLGLLRDMGFFVLSVTAEDSGEAYAVLLAEARHSGVTVIDPEIDTFFSQIGCRVGSEEYKRLMLRLKSRYNMPEDFFRGVAARWLLVNKVLSASMVASPPSLPRIEQLFVDITERIDLRMVTVAADTFTDKTDQPDRAQIAAMFDKYRSVRPGTYEGPGSFGFGYRQPNRVGLVYLQIRREPLQRVIRISDADVRRDYRQNKATYTRQVPIPSPKKDKEGKKDKQKSPAAKDTTTGPAEDESPKFKTVPKTLVEAMPEIREKLTGLEVERQMDKLVADIQERLSSLEAGGAGVAAYRQIRSERLMVDAAREALATRIEKISIEKRPLTEAMDMLASAARLGAICYPWGRPVSDGKELKADTQVTLKAEGITLGEALDRIGKALKVDKLRWAMCRGQGRALFPVSEDVDMFPFSVRKSGLMHIGVMIVHPVLGRAYTSSRGRGRLLSDIAFAAEELERPKGAASLISVGKRGVEMYVRGPGGEVTGRLLWTLSEAVAAHDATELTDKLAERIATDWKVQKAYQSKVLGLAEKIGTEAEKVGLEAAAKKAKLDATVTKPFARRYLGQDQRFPWIRRVVFGSVPGMRLPPMLPGQGEAIQRKILREVFDLAPKNVEPPYPDAPRAVAVIRVPALRAAFVVERIDYRPPVRREFDEYWRSALYRTLMMSQRWDAREMWFRYENIIKRTGFKPAGAERDQAQERS